MNYVIEEGSRIEEKDYSEDFKREAVLTYENSGKSKAEICRLLEISCGSLLDLLQMS